jgi:hypothetical protein
VYGERSVNGKAPLPQIKTQSGGIYVDQNVDMYITGRINDGINTTGRTKSWYEYYSAIELLECIYPISKDAAVQGACLTSRFPSLGW